MKFSSIFMRHRHEAQLHTWMDENRCSLAYFHANYLLCIRHPPERRERPWRHSPWGWTRDAKATWRYPGPCQRPGRRHASWNTGQTTCRRKPRPWRELPGWKTCISGKWRKWRPPRRARRHTSIGWPQGERAIECAMSIWEAAQKWIKRPPCRWPRRWRPRLWGSPLIAKRRMLEQNCGEPSLSLYWYRTIAQSCMPNWFSHYRMPEERHYFAHFLISDRITNTMT